MGQANLPKSTDSHGSNLFVLALNQSAILPAIAIRQLLGLSLRPGLIESCDKRQTRRLLSQNADLAMKYCEVIPGETNSVVAFEAEQYIVKPAFGMSGSDVKIFKEWKDAKQYAESLDNSKEWVPPHVARALKIGRTDTRIIEPYIDGTEFSIDGWIQDQNIRALVQHKLKVIQRTPDGDRPMVSPTMGSVCLSNEWSFIGDGPTVSPLMNSACLPKGKGWSGLKNSEESICNFGRAVLDAMGFSEGVFHIEGRERQSDARLFLIEVNPRAPGGSLWKSARLRTGDDLEVDDLMVQLGKPVPPPNTPTHRYVLHYPFYAANPGILSHWGDLVGPKVRAVPGLTIDFAVQRGHRFREKDMSEEPYLAFAVTYDDTVEGLFAKCQAILDFNPPRVHPVP